MECLCVKTGEIFEAWKFSNESTLRHFGHCFNEVSPVARVVSWEISPANVFQPLQKFP